MSENQPLVAARQRIDKWLFFTRVAKSRSLAQTLVSGGKVTVNGQRIAQPSVQVKPGDMVAVTLERRDVTRTLARALTEAGTAARSSRCHVRFTAASCRRGIVAGLS